MRKIALRAAVSGLLFILALLTALTPGPVFASETREITDIIGRKVTVPIDPQRIVCLGPGTLRLIVYLKALDRVVGVERMERRMGGRPYYLANRAAIDGLPIISPGGPGAINKKPDLEAILKVRPEVIFVTYMQAGLADEVQALLGTPVVVLSYGRFAAFDEVVYDSIRLAGRILNRAQRAEAVIGCIEAGRADLLRRVAGTDPAARPGVFVGGIGFRGSHGLESTDSLYIPFAWLKARNVVKADTASGHVFMDKEKLLSLQPEVIFIDGGGLELVRNDFGRKPAFYKALTAVQSGRAHVLFPFNWYTTNIGTALADAYIIGRVIHPEQFSDIDPAAKADEIYTELVGSPVYGAMTGLYGPLGAKPSFIE